MTSWKDKTEMTHSDPEIGKIPDCFNDMLERQQKADIVVNTDDVLIKSYPDPGPDPIEQVIAEMPRAVTDKNNSLLENVGHETDAIIFRQGVEAQCHLLAKQRYRKVPSEGWLKGQLQEYFVCDEALLEDIAKEVRAKLLMGEPEKLDKRLAKE